MTETRTVRDPFLGKDVEISNRLTDRLRGRYANGPTMPNGEPEFGWREFQTPPVQHEAADEIERLQRGWDGAFRIAAAHQDEVERLRAAIAPFMRYYNNVRFNLRKQPRPDSAAIAEHGERDAIVTWAEFYALRDAVTGKR